MAPNAIGKLMAAAAAAILTTTTVLAQDSLTVSLGADVVSRFVWRGMDDGSGASVQPSLDFSFKGFTLSAWGSTSITDISAKEFDVSLSYEVGGFTATLTDYFWAGEDARYGHYRDDHFYELEASYNFGDRVPLTLSWATMLWAGESKELDEDGDRMFSTYVNASYDFDLHGVTITPSIGITPWKGQYSDSFDVMDVSLTASKELHITDNFTLPIYVQAIASPACDRTYLVFGITF